MHDTLTVRCVRRWRGKRMVFRRPAITYGELPFRGAIFYTLETWRAARAALGLPA